MTTTPAAVPDTGTTTSLQPFVQAGVLTTAELLLAERLGRIGGDTDPSVLLACALALRAPRFSNVCVVLDQIAERVAVEPRPQDPAVQATDEAASPAIVDLDWPDSAVWQRTLEVSPLVRLGGAGETPLVLEHGRLYLDRYWRYEERLAAALTARAAELDTEVDVGALRGWLDELFVAEEPDAADGDATDPADGADSADSEPRLDRQRMAAALAVLRRLTVIAGGPGTGKTYTVTRVLALLHAEALARRPDRPLRVALAAPTGKAAARLQESLRDGLGALTLDAAVRDAMTRTPAFTIHRLLGSRRDSDSRFRHHAGDPLPHDVVIVDEASMVSLPLMAKLVDAVRPEARLVLLGDRDQLASVEAGAAFGDLCGAAGSQPTLQLSSEAIVQLSSALGEDVEHHVERKDPPGVWDAIVRLDRFHRFDKGSHLGEVAIAIQRAADAPDAAIDLLRDGPGEGRDGVRLLDPDTDRTARTSCERAVVSAYEHYVRLALADEVDAEEVLTALGELRVLCALRRGHDGAWAWNAAIEAQLSRAVPGFRTDQPWYIGRPILVTENDYGVRLYNGDVGVILRDPDQPNRRVAAFPATDGTIRMLSPARLPACETTFAMTIHKSQGSQFTHAVVVLPAASSPILTRELVYTAITRAKTRTTLLAREPILREALGRPVQRASGLRQRLWGE